MFSFCCFLGNGHVQWDPNATEDDVDDYLRGIMKASIFVCAVPIDYQKPKFYFSITGEYPTSMLASNMATEELHYPTAKIYSSHWRWQHNNIDPLSKQFYQDEGTVSKANILVFESVTFEFSYTVSI